MAEIVRLEDLKAEEVSVLLAANGRRLDADQAADVHHSASQIRDLKRAFDVLQSLQKLERAA
jgi:hypothetical protein